ncbi:hypothetical protein [Caballeronia mineralivorans]|uniref:hypothetical protein n=1 Tax=Caballeronia mineralivorans TaxID=2010198 RepID=UPI0023F1A89A|nr:hypothetical protein [Caballeronia mineralivorans]MDB5788212.1 hypothetical protein [Caballeronia mineralivorans]
MNKFKKWYSVPEAAALLRQAFEEPVTERDVLDRIDDGDLPVWFNAAGHYAVELHLGCIYYPDPAQNPLFPLVDHPSAEQLALLRCGSGECMLDSSDYVQVLNGRYRLANVLRDDMIDFAGEQKAKTHFIHGMMVYDDDGETLLKIVRRMPDADPVSENVCNFVAAHTETPFPSADLLIASEDLLATIAPPETPETMGTRERDTMLMQIGVLALVVAEHAGVYQLGDKPNVKRVSDTAKELVDRLPDANTRGLSSANFRTNIGKGISLVKGGNVPAGN